MTGPARWLEPNADSTSVERRLLRAGRGLEPRPGAQGRVLAAVLASAGTLGAAGTAAAAGASTGAAAVAGSAKAGASAAGGLGIAGLLKWIGVGALSAGAVLGSAEVVKHDAQQPSLVAPSLSRGPQPTPAYLPPPVASLAREPEPDPTDAATPATSSSRPLAYAWPAPQEREPPSVAVMDSGTVVPAASASSAAAPAASSAPADTGSEAREEAAMTLSARQALQRGNPAGALAVLDQAQQRFPRGRMTQEREALAIESLARLGRKGEAAQRAKAFLQWWPASPYADIVRVHAR